jgi:hypothetical protein
MLSSKRMGRSEKLTETLWKKMQIAKQDIILSVCLCVSICVCECAFTYIEKSLEERTPDHTQWFW